MTRSPRRLLNTLLILLGLCVSTTLLGATIAPKSYTLLINNQLPLRANYELDLLKMVLDVTKREYGDFIITTESSRDTITRKIKNVETDPNVILWASPYNAINQGLSIINYPIMNGVLGLRSLVVSHHFLPQINHITSLEQLKQFTIGQGPGWIDVLIYQDNGFTVTEARLSQLFNMLANYRFDLLPLGRIEIDQATLAKQKGGNALTIAPNHMIYYPHPVLFHLHQKHTKAIKRLEKGLQKISENGELNKLFYQHFPQIKTQLSQPNTYVFKLENNTLPKKYLDKTLDLPLLKDLKH